MVQQKREHSLGGAEGHPARSPGPRHYDHIGCNTEVCPLTATSLWMCPKECGQGGRSCLRMARLAAPPCGLLSSGQQVLSSASSLLAPRESSSIG